MTPRITKIAVSLVASIALAAGSATAVANEQSQVEPETAVTVESASTAETQTAAFEAAMDNAVTAEDSESEYATPQWWAAAGKAAWKGAKWAGKQVAQGGLTEMGRNLIRG